MAGPAPTMSSNGKDRSAGQVHSSGWLGRGSAVRVAAPQLGPAAPRYHRRRRAIGQKVLDHPFRDRKWHKASLGKERLVPAQVVEHAMVGRGLVERDQERLIR